VTLISAGFDEVPMAYKNIREVIYGVVRVVARNPVDLSCFFLSESTYWMHQYRERFLYEQ
jgi:hypothetical protein